MKYSTSLHILSCFKITILSYVLGFFAVEASSQSIEITIKDTLQRPIRDVQIQCILANNVSNTSLSDPMGKASIECPVGNTLYVYRLGYYPQLDTLKEVSYKKTYELVPRSFDIAEVIVTGQIGAGTDINSVFETKVLNTADLEKRGFYALDDIFLKELGFQVNQDNLLGAGVEINGISGSNVKILRDGIPIIGRRGGNIDISQLNLNNIERIEIIESPQSVNYGSDAIGGVINLISKEPDVSQSAYSELSSYYETVGKYRLNSNNYVPIKKSGLNIGLGASYFDGWQGRSSGRQQEWKPKQQANIDASYQFAPLIIGDLKYTVNLGNEKLYDKGAIRGDGETAFDNTYTTQRLDQNIGLVKRFSSSELQLQSAYNLYHREKLQFLNNLATGEKSNTASSNQDTTDNSLFFSKAQFSWLQETWKTQVGAELSNESLEGSQITGRNQKDMIFATYSNIEHAFHPHVTARIGARYTLNTSYPSFPVPALNLKYDNDRTAIRLSGSYGFRAPSLKERYFRFVDTNHDIVGNPNLRSENSKHINLSSSKKWNLEGQFLQIGITSFYNKLNNLIQLVSDSRGVNSFTYANIAEYTSLGAKANAKLQNNRQTVRMEYGITRKDLLNQTSFLWSNNYGLLYEYFIPKLDLTIGAQYRFQGKPTFFSLDAKGELVQSALSDYHLLDLSISKTFFNNRMNGSLGLNNILDVKQLKSIDPVSGFHTAGEFNTFLYGRSAYFSLSYTFQAKKS